jgi:hypothetical protein
MTITNTQYTLIDYSSFAIKIALIDTLTFLNFLTQSPIRHQPGTVVNKKYIIRYYDRTIIIACNMIKLFFSLFSIFDFFLLFIMQTFTNRFARVCKNAIERLFHMVVTYRLHNTISKRVLCTTTHLITHWLIFQQERKKSSSSLLHFSRYLLPLSLRLYTFWVNRACFCAINNSLANLTLSNSRHKRMINIFHSRAKRCVLFIGSLNVFNTRWL